jgi:hypothetical protein
MPSRRKSSETESSMRVPTPARSGPALRAGVNRRSPDPTDATTKRWHLDVRARAICSAVSATTSLLWSSSLIEALLEEMYVGDGFEGLLGESPSQLQVRRYPQAVLVALILRHAWRADDLACILARLGVTVGGSLRKFKLAPTLASPKTTGKRGSS